MSGIPLDLERRFERRWAARFSGPAKERHVKAQQQQQRVTVPEESKRRRRGTGGFAISNLRPDSLAALLSRVAEKNPPG
jgi:hypothetical protein